MKFPIARGVWSDRARTSNGCLSGVCDSRNDDPRIRANDDFKRRRAPHRLQLGRHLSLSTTSRTMTNTRPTTQMGPVVVTTRSF